MKILQNVDTALKTMKMVCFLVITGSLVFSGYIYYSSMILVEQSGNKVYLLNQGDALELVRSRNGTDNIVAEIKNHVTMFHQFFYDLDPDPIDIKARINKALFLIDDSGKQIHFKREEALYYHQLVDGSISSRVYIDSIVPRLDNNIYFCKIYARQKFIRSSKVTEKRIDAECKIRSVARTDNNPHGFLIEKYNLINNNTLYEQSK